MLRSLFNSARGRPAVILDGRSAASARATPYLLEDFSPPSLRRPNLPPEPSPADPAEDASAVLPDRCCVYCGHGLYVPPRMARVRCPKCLADLPAKDVLLTGDVEETQVVTAGKITVAPGARVAADLVACTVEIAGMVLGDVLASHRCRVTDTGKLAGRILCRRLDIAPGATVEGPVELVQL